MKKESEKIKGIIDKLISTKKKLESQLKPTPKGIYKRQFTGISVFTGRENYTKILTYKNDPISKEKLDELKKQAIEHNTPIQSELQEIGEVLPRLNEMLIKAKADELLTANKNEPEINEFELVDFLLRVILGDDIKKYSLRNFATSLNKAGFDIDFRTLGNRFKKINFQYLIIAGIMTKTSSLKKQEDKQKLESFREWFEENYMRGKKIYKKNSFGKSIGVNEQLTDSKFLTDRKSGKSGIHPGLLQDDELDKMGLN